METGFIGLASLCGLMLAAVSEQLAVLKLIARRFDELRVPYMVTGSIAAGLYGQPRMTRDIDLVAELHPAHAALLAERLAPEFACDVDSIKDAIAARRMFNVIHREALEKVDVIVRTDSDYEIEKFSRRRAVDLDGTTIWVIAPEDLVLSKLVWAKDSRSEMHLRDVRQVIATQSGLDWPYIERWALRLTVTGLLKEVRA